MEKYIEAATEHFKKLLCEQLERASRLENAAKRKDFSRQNKIVIGVCYGDGIGPIICREAEALLFELLKNEIANGKIELKTIEGLTIENRLKCGQPIPSDVLTEIKSCDVLLKGPTTTPNGGTMESANVSLRRELDLYANLRPISIPEKNIDWAFFRENTEGEYTLGSKGIEIPEKLAMDFKVTTDAGTKRIARAAFEYARENGKKRVSIVTKANIMKKTDGKFSKICHEIASEYPDILCDEWYIDIMCANLVNESIRSYFEVILLPNLYGDIITDEAAQIQGGVGTAGSANIGDEYAMFEAIHGSAPRMIEEGIGEYANPSSIFVACQMLLRHIGMQKSAEKLERAMQICTETEKKVIVTGNRDGATCKEFANYVIETVRAL
jgi:isocitrate dehydrogenase (NAD+)